MGEEQEPADDRCAIPEFEWMRTLSVSFAVFAWMAFWWLEHYAGSAEYLRSRFPLVLENDRLQVFDLREDAP